MGEVPKLAQVRQWGEQTDIGGLARRGALSLGGAAISAVASLLVVVVITRGFGKADAGALFSATSLFVIAESLCAMGTVTGLVYFIARVRALDQPSEVHHVIKMAILPVTVVAVIVATLTFFFSSTVAGIVQGPDGTMSSYIRVLAVFLPFAVLFDVLIAGTQGFHTMTPTVLLEKIGRPTLQILLVVAALELGKTWALPLAWACPYAVGLTFVAGALARLTGKERRATVPAEPVVSRREFWRYTGPRGVAAVAQLTLQRLDIVLVASMLGAREAAIYTAATRFVVLGQLGSQAVALAVQPKFSELLAKQDLAGAQHVYKMSTAWVISVTWPIHILVAVLAPIILLMFGAGYEEGRWVMVILAGSMLVATGCGMVSMLLVMAGRTTANLVNVAIALTANLVLNILLIPRLGIVGAAIAWALSIVLSNLAPLFEIRLSMGLSPFGRASARSAALALVALGALPSLGWMLSGNKSLVIGLAACGVVLYTAGTWRLRKSLQLDSLLSPIAARMR